MDKAISPVILKTLKLTQEIGAFFIREPLLNLFCIEPFTQREAKLRRTCVRSILVDDGR